VAHFDNKTTNFSLILGQILILYLPEK